MEEGEGEWRRGRESGGEGESSGGSRGFLLVLKNYPFSELKFIFLLSSS